MKQLLFFAFSALSVIAVNAQKMNFKNDQMRSAAIGFLKTLSPSQQQQARFPFEDEERYNWNFVPMARKGIPLKALTETQRDAAMRLLQTALSDSGYKKTRAIIDLENILRQVENRPENDEYRDQGKYYFTVFGKPESDSIWGWRLEGHHVAFNFSSDGRGLVSGT